MLKCALEGTLVKLKVSELKDFLKRNRCTQAGDKGTLAWRIACFLDGEYLLVDGKNPAQLPKNLLKKQCAKRGLSCVGNVDEMLTLLMADLRKAHPGKVVTAGANPNDPNDSNFDDAEDSSINIAQQILVLSERFDYTGILSLMGDNVTESTPTGKMRKAYLKLSLLVHPDKLKSDVATKAFQAVITAFERLTKPELFVEEEGEGGTKAKKISRSNKGCFRTKIFCPRCHVQWGTNVDGVPEYFYNFFMQALRTYHCSTCLLDFGCMTAEHHCPYCNKSFEYTPNDFHRKITCQNAKCTSPFGFYMYHVSENIEKELRLEIKDEQVKRIKKEEATRRRLQRAKRKHGESDEFNSRKQRKHREKLFKKGLLDACPRCGYQPETDGEEREHLRNCQDKEKWVAHMRTQLKDKKKLQLEEQKLELQVEMQSKAAWEFLGGATGNLWLLTHKGLKKQCKDSGLDEEGTKDELIARLASHRSEMDSRLLMDGTRGKAKKGKTRVAFSLDSLPTNLHTMSTAQIKSVCAAHGYVPTSRYKDEIIEEIEQLRDQDKGVLYLK